MADPHPAGGSLRAAVRNQQVSSTLTCIMPLILLAVMALLAGSSIALQAGVNSQLRTWLGNPLQAAFVSFAVGTLVLAVYTVIERSPWSFAGVSRAPWWVWTGGVLGAYIVTALILVAPRLGASVLLGLVVTGQMVTSMVLDHYGLLGFPQQRVTLARLLGVLLLIVGVILIRKY